MIWLVLADSLLMLLGGVLVGLSMWGFASLFCEEAVDEVRRKADRET